MKPTEELSDRELRRRLKQVQASLEAKFRLLDTGKVFSEKQHAYFELMEAREADTLRELRARGLWEKA